MATPLGQHDAGKWRATPVEDLPLAFLWSSKYLKRMALPVITEENIKQILPAIESAEQIGRGGQKIVFRILSNGAALALKFALLPATFRVDNADIDETILRAQRETQIMQECDSPHMVKMGPIPLGTSVILGSERSLLQKSLSKGRL